MKSIKNTSILITITSILILLITSYDKSGLDTLVGGVNFGTAIYHPQFLFSKERNDTITKNIEFNGWAEQNNASVIIAIYDEQNQLINESNDDVKVYVNDVLMSNGELELNANERQSGLLKMSLVLSSKLTKGALSGDIKIIHSDLDRVNSIDADSDTTIYTWSAHRKTIMNPLAKGLLTFVLLTLTILLIWLIIIRPIFYARFKKGVFTIQSPFFNNIKLKGTIHLTLTNTTPAPQKLWERLFKGKNINYVHPFFHKDILIRPRSKDKILMDLNSGYSIQPFVTSLKRSPQVYTITNLTTKEEITFTYN